MNLSEKFYLGEFKKNCQNTRSMNILLVGTHPEVSQVLLKFLTRYGLIDNRKANIYSLSDLSIDFSIINSNSSPAFVVSKHSRKTIVELQQEKKVLEKLIVETKNGSNFIVFYSLENPLLVNCSVVYPKSMIELFRLNNSTWQRLIFPYNEVSNSRPIRYSFPKIIETKSDEIFSDLFGLLINCLYPSNQYQEIEKIKNFKDNVFLVSTKLHDKNLMERYEVVKIDSLSKISKEIKNFNSIYNNQLAGKIYHVRDAVIYNGEYVGAIRSCAENPLSSGGELLTLREILMNSKNLCKDDFKNIISSINDCMNSLHNVGGKKEANNSFFLYKNKIIPYNIDLFIKKGLNQLAKIDGNNELTIIKRRNTFIETGKLRPKICKMKLEEIAPDVDEINRCSLSLQLLDKDKKPIKIRCPYYKVNWREDFNRFGLKAGDKVKITDAEQVGYLLQIFRELKKLDFVQEIKKIPKNEYDKRIELGERQNLSEKEKNEVKKIIKKKKLTINLKDEHEHKILNPIFYFDKFNKEADLLLRDIVGPSHGDLNLDNILVHKTKRNNQNNHNSHQFERRYDYKAIIIDLAQFGTDFPLSFDFVKLEVEIKNHIIVPYVLKINKSIDNKDEKKNKIYESFILLEKQINGSKKKIDIKWPEEIRNIIILIKKIRNFGMNRYETNREKSIKLYNQVLFFYSLRSMTYRKLKYSKWAKTLSFLGAAKAVEQLEI